MAIHLRAFPKPRSPKERDALMAYAIFKDQKRWDRYLEARAPHKIPPITGYRSLYAIRQLRLFLFWRFGFGLPNWAC
jgi:hypothetical protein